MTRCRTYVFMHVHIFAADLLLIHPSAALSAALLGCTCRTWLIYTCDMTHCHMRSSRACLCLDLRLIPPRLLVWDMTHLHVCHHSFSRERPDSFICVTWLVVPRTFARISISISFVDSLLGCSCGTWLIYMCYMTHCHMRSSRVFPYLHLLLIPPWLLVWNMTHFEVWHDSFRCSHVWRYSFLCVTWLIATRTVRAHVHVSICCAHTSLAPRVAHDPFIYSYLWHNSFEYSNV